MTRRTDGRLVGRADWSFLCVAVVSKADYDFENGEPHPVRPLPLSNNGSRREAIGRPMEVLLVEDSLVSARIAIGSLRQSPLEHRMTWLRDGAEAMRFLDRRAEYRQAPQPDLILLDLRLPHLDGRDVLAKIRSHADEAVRGLPVVIMTASDDAEDAKQADALDVQAYLSKPIDVARFLDVVQELKDYWRADMVLPSTVSA